MVDNGIVHHEVVTLTNSVPSGSISVINISSASPSPVLIILIVYVISPLLEIISLSKYLWVIRSGVAFDGGTISKGVITCGAREKFGTAIFVVLLTDQESVLQVPFQTYDHVCMIFQENHQGASRVHFANSIDDDDGTIEVQVVLLLTSVLFSDQL